MRRLIVGRDCEKNVFEGQNDDSEVSSLGH